MHDGCIDQWSLLYLQIEVGTLAPPRTKNLAEMSTLPMPTETSQANPPSSTAGKSKGSGLFGSATDQGECMIRSQKLLLFEVKKGDIRRAIINTICVVVMSLCLKQVGKYCLSYVFSTCP